MAAESCYDGTVVDKKAISSAVVSPTDSAHTIVSTDSAYTLVLEVEYEYYGETKTAQREVTVSEDVFLAYDIGDDFVYDVAVSESDMVSASDVSDTSNASLAPVALLFGAIIASFGIIVNLGAALVMTIDGDSESDTEKTSKEARNWMIMGAVLCVVAGVFDILGVVVAGGDLLWFIKQASLLLIQ